MKSLVVTINHKTPGFLKLKFESDKADKGLLTTLS